MELRHLRCFSVLADCEHVTRAAEKLFITQSTLSHAIKQLEEELGVALFDRVGKRVVLNKDGSQFLNTALRTLRELDEGIVSLRHSACEQTSSLTVGTIHTFNVRLIPSCIADFVAGNPSVKVTVIELPAEQAEARLLAGEFDVCISYPPKDPSAFWCEILFNEEMVLAVPHDHQFASRSRIRMAELHRERLILPPLGYGSRNLLDRCFRSISIEPTVVVEVSSFVSGLEISQKLKVPVLLSRTAVQATPGVKIVRIEDPKPSRTPVLLWNKQVAQSSATRSFVDIVKATVSGYID
ncbi:LysR family transcriptional regulator [Pseudomonas promysalinigenes]|uniref:LysR family transcriptional regulator n=1 Tax=Pseudomonas promysalinigenes TaxID=485898 RepID=UPI00271DD5E1